tara:strand:- start:45 stop:230 length:186 start_codon:yes stop_codon:yes gene_type:complete
MAYPIDPIYKFMKNPITGQVDSIKRKTDGNRELHIPLSEDNTDYQTYLAWVSDGGTAEVAD